MNYREAINKIDSLLVYGSQPGLERISKLLELMGNPQDTLRYVHIAGTNGKGSVSNMTASILQEAGYKTGLFTSPHITGFGERMQINFQRISDEEIITQVEELFPLVEELRKNGVVITEFEFVTAMAFNWFSQQQCDIVVLETGLGGRFDSTNVIKTPLCSIITSISLDHTAVLGDTLEKIAIEKCGIIKDGGSTVFAFQEDEVNSIVVKTVYERNNILYNPLKLPVTSMTIHGSEVQYGDLKLRIPLLGQHQISNAGLVLCAIEALRKAGLDITDEAIKQGISRVKMPARFELINDEPLIILDGAHNPGGMKALGEAIDTYLSGKRIICVMGMLKDKDCANSLKYLQGKIYKLITTTVKDNPRRQTAEELKETAKSFFEDITAEESSVKATELALKAAKETSDSAILICGSLYLASEIRRRRTTADNVRKNHAL